MAKKKIKPGMTRQNVRDLNSFKGKSVGIVLPMPPNEALDCTHPLSAIREDRQNGSTYCTNCKCEWDFDGNPI